MIYEPVGTLKSLARRKESAMKTAAYGAIRRATGRSLTLSAEITWNGYLKINCHEDVREGGVGHLVSITSIPDKLILDKEMQEKLR